MDDRAINIELGELFQEPIAEYPIPWGHGVIAWGYPDDAKVMTFLCPAAYDVVCQHGESSCDKEVVGVLVGNVYFCPKAEKTYTIVEAAIPASLATSTKTRVIFEHEAWAPVLEAKEKQFPERRIVGWYHTHPSFGAFFSTDDQFWHRLAFPNFWQVALVYDPISKHACFFGWNSDCIEPICGFYELLSKGQKFSRIARLATDWNFEHCRERPSIGDISGKGSSGIISARQMIKGQRQHTADALAVNIESADGIAEFDSKSLMQKATLPQYKENHMDPQQTKARWEKTRFWIRCIGFLLIGIAAILYIVVLTQQDWLSFSKLNELLTGILKSWKP